MSLEETRERSIGRDPLENSIRGLLPRARGDPRGGEGRGEGSTGVWAEAVCPIGSTEGSLGRLGL